jgi:hypothetical protein
MTWLTLMPEDAARSRLSATARIALPIFVRCSISATSTRTTREMISEARSALVMRNRP